MSQQRSRTGKEGRDSGGAAATDPSQQSKTTWDEMGSCRSKVIPERREGKAKDCSISADSIVTLRAGPELNRKECLKAIHGRGNDRFTLIEDRPLSPSNLN